MTKFLLIIKRMRQNALENNLPVQMIIKIFELQADIFASFGVLIHHPVAFSVGRSDIEGQPLAIVDETGWRCGRPAGGWDAVAEVCYYPAVVKFA